MAGSEQKSGLAERVKGKLQARKQRRAERARIAGGLKRDRENAAASRKKGMGRGAGG
jgi:hypothetical protein